MTVGLHRVRVTSGVAVVDIDCEVSTVTIRHGRDGPNGQPDASSAVVTLPVSELPSEAEIGALVEVSTYDGAAWRSRFSGRVTDLAVTWTAGGSDPVPVPEASITAVGPLAQLGRRYVGDAPWPVELDGARAARILAAAGAVVGIVDPGKVNVLARDVDLRSAQELLQSLATSAGGILWETTGGLIGYADADHRRNAAVAVTLDACDVLMAPVWSRTVEALVNDVAVAYGVAPDGGQQPTYAESRADSIASYGRYAYTLSTELAAVADATARAQLVLVRNAQPSWNLSTLPLDLAILDLATTSKVLGLELHSLLGLTGFPSGGPATSLSLWVEGWSERLSYGGHEMTLAVSAYCATVPPPQWDSVPPEWTWDGLASLSHVRRNLVANPRIGVDLNSWNAYGGVNTRVAGQSAAGWALGTTTALRATFDGTAAPYLTGTYTNLYPCTPGLQYAALLQARSNRPQRVGISLEFYDNAVDWTYLGTTWDTDYADALVLTPNVVSTLVSRPFVCPPGATVVLVGVYPAPNNSGDGGPTTFPWVAGDWLETTNAHIEQTVETLTTSRDPVTGIFNGARPDTLTDDYAWTGAADASPSTRTTPPMMTWDSATCLGPMPSLGRWADVSASTRWDDVDAGIGWDAWPY